ncbi:MAG: hypothetical protein WCG02_02195 [Candidatus Taylorbacteria bacterium]
MKLFNTYNSRRNQAGYTLLFAVLTASLVLGVAAFILSVSRAQFILASAARESTYAIYAADSGIECAAAAAASISTSSPSGSVTCAGQSAVLVTFPNLMVASVGTLYNFYTSAPIYLNLGESRCAKITFVKGFSGAGATGDLVTQIESRGYNFCDLSNKPDTANPKVVERAIRLTYLGM